MLIPVEAIVSIFLAAFGFLFGAVWGHHKQLSKCVTHDQCSHKRETCPCVREMQELKENLGAQKK